MLEGLGTKLEKDVLLDKYRKPELNATLVKEWAPLTKEFLKILPFSLTRSQLSAVAEIIWDLKRPVPMNRLLQVFYLCYFVLCNFFRKNCFALHFLVKIVLNGKGLS